jgi:hypothetical protein
MSSNTESKRGFTPQVSEALAERENDLLGFSHRLSHGLSVHEDLVRVTRGRRFVVRHLPIWRMLLSERDMTFVDIASWAKAIYSPRGFLRRLHGRDLAVLARCWKYRQDGDFEVEGACDPEDRLFLQGHWQNENAKWRDAAFDRLFPDARSGAPNQQDIDGLVGRLSTQFEPLLADRHEHRAHRYENAAHGKATMLSPPDVAEHLRSCQQLLADLRSLSSNSGFSAPGYKPKADPDDHEAQDVVDLVLRGTVNEVFEQDRSFNDGAASRTYYWQRRAAYYDALHEAHERRNATDDDPFNLPWAVDGTCDRTSDASP